MDFNFNVNELFKAPLVEIDSTLIPPEYSGNRRMLYDVVSKVGQIIDEMGSASAYAQGLSRPITSADKLKKSQHKLYIAIDQMANYGKGAIAGILKTGNKNLYLCDRKGANYQLNAPYLHDFYVHPNRQRMGWGKYLYDSMLLKEETEPVKIAIDQPTDQLLSFLDKHYSLKDPVKQVNKFVVFDGFFHEHQVPVVAATIDPGSSEDEDRPVGRSKTQKKYQLVFQDEDEKEMYKPKNLLA